MKTRTIMTKKIRTGRAARTAICAAALLGLAGTAAFAGGGGDKGSGSGSDKKSEGAAGLMGQTISGEITVGCYDTMAYAGFLNEAARRFEAAYPGTTIHVETAAAMPVVRSAETAGGRMTTVQAQDDTTGRMDYINRVNTALMGGRAADILAMDVLPLGRYVDAGYLENLDDWIAADAAFDPAAYRANILDAARYRDHLWFLPVAYTFNYYTYDSTLVPEAAAARAGLGDGAAVSARSLEALGEGVYDGKNYLFNLYDFRDAGGPSGDLFARLVAESGRGFVDLDARKARFNDGAFAALLEDVGRWTGAGYAARAPRAGGAGGAGPGRQAGPGLAQATERAAFKSKISGSLLQDVNRRIRGSSNVRMAMGGTLPAIEDDDRIAGIAANENGDVTFDPQVSFAMNTASSNKRLAWEFLKFVMSEESQLSTALEAVSLPTHNQARAKKAEMFVSGAILGGEARTLSERDREALDAYRATVEALSGRITACNREDEVVNAMIRQEAAYFFNGSKTAAACAAALQSKVELYLNE